MAYDARDYIEQTIQQNPQAYDAYRKRGAMMKGIAHKKEVDSRKTYIWIKGADGIVIEADLHDSLCKGSDGKIPPDLLIMCPRCNRELNIPGNKKTIHIEEIEPRWTPLADGSVVKETCRITVDQPITCSYEQGKGICGWRAKITHGVASRV
jgi:hypothetical protein